MHQLGRFKVFGVLVFVVGGLYGYAELDREGQNDRRVIFPGVVNTSADRVIEHEEAGVDLPAEPAGHAAIDVAGKVHG